MLTNPHKRTKLKLQHVEHHKNQIYWFRKMNHVKGIRTVTRIAVGGALFDCLEEITSGG